MNAQRFQWCIMIAMVYHASNRLLKKTQNLPLKFGYFHFSLSSSTSLTAFQLPIFLTILSIHRSEPRFKRHTGGKITKTLKNDGNFDGLCQFSAKSDSKFPSRSRNERQDIQLSIEKKITFVKCLQTMADLTNVPPPLDLTRILKSYHKRNDRRKFPEKKEQLIPCEINCTA